ncbi:MAG: fatty acid oxidation complex subunit alpha FadJ [Armatimonadetes bacterium]|nr:MAG: fatty acid oxidation complex subunit alpha FadJ [Armatimonadota bacterium]
MEYKNYHFELTEQGVAVVLMDRHDEAMNTLGEEFVRELAIVVDRLEQPDVKAVVIGSAKKDFLAGADIKMFTDMEADETAVEALQALHEIYDRIEALHQVADKPVVAAITGACLGGGLELALTASMRICTDTAQLGQPEVQLGLIPGAGGTQRLPALVGIQNGLQMIVTGRPVRPYKAKKMGLVDEIVPTEKLLDIARKRAVEAIGTQQSKDGIRSKLRVAAIKDMALEGNPAGRKMLFKKATEMMVAETGGNYPAPRRAIEAIQIGIDHGRAAGVAAEIRFFAELVETPESAALRSIFFASQELKRDTGIDSHVDPLDVDTVAVLGGGLMGGGIAAVSAINAGVNVRIKEIDDAGVGRGLAYVDRVVSKRAKRRRMSEFEVDQIMNRVTGSTTWDGFERTDLVIEAVFEDLDLKRSIVKDVEAVVSKDTIFASNTSTLPITEIAKASNRPDKVVGMHYFSPVEKMPLLEVITTEKTSDETTATAVAFGKRQGKTVIVVNDGTGFYTSRVLGPYTNEAGFLLAEGASVEDIDSAMKSWGFPIGPLLLGDEVGIDVGAHISEIFLDAFGDRMKGPDMMAALVADDRKGRKNGRGFYIYDKGERKGVDDSVYGVLGLGAPKGMARSEIQERLSMAFLNEAALCLEEGILRSARDGDIGAVFGLGYPPFRGGPFWTIDTMGADVVVNKLDALAAKHGKRFTPAQILRDHAESGERFRT